MRKPFKRNPVDLTVSDIVGIWTSPNAKRSGLVTILERAASEEGCASNRPRGLFLATDIPAGLGREESDGE